MEVLLVIDMQKLSFTPKSERYDSDGTISRINKLTENFRKKDKPVIFVQHDGTKHGYCNKGSSKWEILDELVVKQEDIILPKTAHDAFYKTNLKTMLKEMLADTVVVTGCATDFCVDATIKGALVNDLNVKIISDGHTTADKIWLKAEEAISYFNWLWSENIPTEGKITVLDTAEYL